VSQSRPVRYPGFGVFALWFLAATAGAALDPASIPSPRPQGWVVDQARLLSAEDIAALNALGDAVRQRDGAEMAIVTVGSTGGAEPRAFATTLFNRWEIGDRVRNNGLLLFVAIGDRSAEIVLGDGIDSDAGVARSDRIMQEVIVPRFRRGDNAGAIVAGARACAAAFFFLPDTAAPSAEVTAVESETPPPAQMPFPRPQGSIMPPVSEIILLVLVLLLFGGMGAGGWLGLRLIQRRRSRRCRGCGKAMTKLGESEDDAFLEPGERKEEAVGSVDYDVWMCPGCGQVEKLRYGKWFTRYSRCAHCGAVTTNKSTKTLRAATTASGGLVEVHEHCAHCNQERTYTQATPRVSTSSSSSSSHRSSSGFGGGHSSGRGSSGKW
jgi:uncharacterized protein